MAPPPTAMFSVQKLRRVDVIPSPPPTSPVSVPLSFFDLPWLHTGPVERLFFFRNALDPTAPLLSSLAAALRLFPILTAQIDKSDSGFFYTYSDGDSLPLTVAECADPAAFGLLATSGPRDLAELRRLVPALEEGRLAAVQLTLFLGAGFCIGVSIHHVACDDAAAMSFVKTWAAACNSGGGGPPPPPVFDRALVSSTDRLARKLLDAMRQADVDAAPPPPLLPPDAVGSTSKLAAFLLGKEHIDRIKSKLAGIAVHASAFVAACAVAWVCLLRVQKATKKTAHLLFSVDCRARLVPPVPAEYFGNCLRPCFVEADRHELLGDKGVIAAATAIGIAIKELENGVLEGAEEWGRKIMSVLPEAPMSVGGSPRFKVYDTDFGWGTPVRVDMASIKKTPGTVSLAEGRGEEEGAVEIGVVLPAAEMAEFASCFTDIISLL